MQVTPIRAAAILVFAIASPLQAQGIEVFAGYSANADYIQNRGAIPVVDQKVSPSFSHGSGLGFQVSFKREVRKGLGIKIDGKLCVLNKVEHRTPGNLRAMVFELIGHAEAQGLGPPLFDAALATARGNPDL